MKAEETEVFFISCFLRGVQAHGWSEKRFRHYALKRFFLQILSLVPGTEKKSTFSAYLFPPPP
jgi:hypothetical protein